MSYRLLHHTSDLGIEVWALNKDELFCEAARALFSEVVNDLISVEPRITKEITLKEEAAEDLLKEWLSTLLYWMDTEGLLFSDFQVKINENGLEGVVKGEKMSMKRHKLKRVVKGVTYHNLSLREEPWGWVATIVLDI
ncbi:MAG: archease [candidate division WOR-3 bacterium]